MKLGKLEQTAFKVKIYRNEVLKESFPYEVTGLSFMDPNATRDQVAKAGLKWLKNCQNSRKAIFGQFQDSISFVDCTFIQETNQNHQNQSTNSRNGIGVEIALTPESCQ